MLTEKRKINFIWIFTAVATAIFWVFAMYGIEYYHTLNQPLKILFVAAYVYGAFLNVYFLAIADLQYKTVYKMQ